MSLLVQLFLLIKEKIIDLSDLELADITVGRKAGRELDMIFHEGN